ncbi:unnamed protein product (mitochondrion) [Plasmodiophora brassicae]|uniref:Smr domain-containing protein n=1 Tax=Plasmodiophora brassicae TaxID=37360 RepID=A0A3P3YK32_PLABS|nr:unnamed protein product [Plasmodiophora brassicae]
MGNLWSSAPTTGDQYRAEAAVHAARRAELLSRSQAAWRAGDKALAKSLSDAGKAEGARVLEANARAADAYFTSNNKGRPVAEVDLHGLFADEAVVRIEERIKACRAAGQPHLVVIVGQGNHSKDGIPVLKPRIRNLMEHSTGTVAGSTYSMQHAPYFEIFVRPLRYSHRIVTAQDQRVLHLPYRLPLSFLRRMSAALPLNFSLCRLVLSGCSIDDVGGRMVAKALRESKALRDVDLGRNVLGDRTAVDLANALSVNDVLVRLDLRCNPIGDIGAKALCKMLSCNTTLTSLSLYECCIGNRGMAALADALRISSTLQRLDVLDNLNTNRYF